MSLIVQKFGGTSVANTERLKNVADIVTKTAQAGNQVVVVVSAQGDTTDDLIVKAAELNDRPSKREMDVLLNTGEMISMSLLAMAIQKLGFPVVSLTVGRLVWRPTATTRMLASSASQVSASRQSWITAASLLLQASRASTRWAT